VRLHRIFRWKVLDRPVLELLIHYKNNNHEIEYQDCYGVFIKIQDLIENFADALTLLVSCFTISSNEGRKLAARISFN
jgi:hypothetical protein